MHDLRVPEWIEQMQEMLRTKPIDAGSTDASTAAGCTLRRVGAADAGMITVLSGRCRAHHSNCRPCLPGLPAPYGCGMPSAHEEGRPPGGRLTEAFGLLDPLALVISLTRHTTIALLHCRPSPAPALLYRSYKQPKVGSPTLGSVVVRRTAGAGYPSCMFCVRCLRDPSVSSERIA